MEKETIYSEIREQIFIMYRNIKYLREKNGLTTKQLAEILKMREQKLIEAENCFGVGYFHEKQLKNACAYFQISTDELLSENLIQTN